MEQTEQVEVRLLNYTFKFKRMRWQEEFSIKFPPKKNMQRVMLAYALLEVSGVRPKDVEEALRVMDAVPSAIISRVFRIWKGSFPAARRFTTLRLYAAPDPTAYVKRREEEEEEEESAHDRAVQQMESKFAPEDIAETRKLNLEILKAARRKEGGYRGAVPATEDK